MTWHYYKRPRWMTAIGGFFTGLGVAGVVGIFALIAAGIAGWVMNLYKLFAHSPELAQWGVEQVVRLVGIIPIVGAIVGWF